MPDLKDWIRKPLPNLAHNRNRRRIETLPKVNTNRVIAHAARARKGAKSSVSAASMSSELNTLVSLSMNWHSYSWLNCIGPSADISSFRNSADIRGQSFASTLTRSQPSPRRKLCSVASHHKFGDTGVQLPPGGDNSNTVPEPPPPWTVAP